MALVVIRFPLCISVGAEMILGGPNLIYSILPTNAALQKTLPSSLFTL